MTDKEIVKALECCKKDDCDNCPNDFGNCYANLAGCSLDLINRKQAEIEKLKIENQSLRAAANSYKLYYKEAGTEAIKEFAKRLKNSIYINTNLLVYQCEEVESVIDDIVKEMVGDNK